MRRTAHASREVCSTLLHGRASADHRRHSRAVFHRFAVVGDPRPWFYARCFRLRSVAAGLRRDGGAARGICPGPGAVGNTCREACSALLRGPPRPRSLHAVHGPQEARRRSWPLMWTNDKRSLRRCAPLCLSALAPAFQAAKAVGGYAIQRAASPQSGVRFSGLPCGGRHGSSVATPAPFKPNLSLFLAMTPVTFSPSCPRLLSVSEHHEC